MNIEELEDIDFNDLIQKNMEENDYEDEEELIDIFKLYSDPYFSTDAFSYLFKLSIDNNELLLDEAKIENSDSLEETGIIDDEKLIVIKNVYKNNMGEAFRLINNNIDIRDGNTILNQHGEPLCFDTENKSKEDINAMLEKNKLIVLSELYLELSQEQ